GIAGAFGYHYLRDDRRGQPVASAPPADARQAPAPPRASDHPARPAAHEQPTAVAAHAQVTHTTAHAHDKQLAADVHELQSGATCAERKKAIAKLVELGDHSSVAALKKAR